MTKEIKELEEMKKYYRHSSDEFSPEGLNYKLFLIILQLEIRVKQLENKLIP